MAAKVLLIEDERNIAEAIRFVLSRHGFDVAVHPDGIGAAAAVRAALPDVVILDLMLPGIGGLEILTDIRSHPATAAIPVLMLTARGAGRDRDACTRAGASRFMTKPFANAEVLEAVRALAGS